MNELDDLRNEAKARPTGKTGWDRAIKSTYALCQVEEKDPSTQVYMLTSSGIELLTAREAYNTMVKEDIVCPIWCNADGTGYRHEIFEKYFVAPRYEDDNDYHLLWDVLGKDSAPTKATTEAFSEVDVPCTLDDQQCEIEKEEPYFDMHAKDEEGAEDEMDVDVPAQQYFYMSNGKPYDKIEDCPPSQLVTRVPLLCGGGRRKGKYKKGKRKPRRNGGNNMVKIGQLGLRNPSTSIHFTPKVLDEWRYEQIIETDGAGNFSAAIALRNPLTALNGSGTYTRSQGFANLYDEYKVLSVGVIVDFLVNNPATGFGRMAVDFDSIFAGPYTGADLLGNEYMREFQGYNQISFSSKVPKLASGSYRGQPVVITQGGYYDFNTPPDEGQIILVGERYPAGGRIANVTLTMRVVMRRRRTINQAKEERLQEEEQRRERTKK